MLRDPEEILNKARDSFEKGDYKSSLENYQWFFTHAVQIDSTWVGAKYKSLKEWYCLAEKYQPAYEALIKQKDTSLFNFQQLTDPTRSISHSFHISRYGTRQRKLRRLLKEANTKGCLAYRQDAWIWATRPIAY